MMIVQVAIAFRRELLTCLANYGYAGVPVLEARQPTKQGRIDDGIYYRVMNPKNYGWQARRYDYVNGEGHTEKQLIESQFRISTFVHNDELTGYNSEDLANITQMCVNSLPFVEQMRRAGLGVQRASSVRVIDFIDEADNYASEAVFDLNITFMRTINPPTSTVEFLQPRIKRV